MQQYLQRAFQLALLLSANFTTGRSRFAAFLAYAAALATIVAAVVPAKAQQPRALGLDISAWQGNISQTTWNNIRNVENRQFVFLRSSRGGTTGYYNQSDSDNSDGLNTLSQRYDDPYYVQNINRATAAGIYSGSYHFGRMDIIASTLNSNGIPNNGTDEANHFIQMAGAFMRPGYMLPVFDFEAGNGARTPTEQAEFAIAFSDRIHEVMGIRPAVYTGNNYSSPLNNIALAEEVVAAYPTLWIARWPNQADPNAIPVQTADPGDYTPTVYGPWDNPPNPADPWDFWQYASTGRLQSFNNGGSNLDFDVAKGGSEFLKDHLVPAVWMRDADDVYRDGDWNTMSKWNSGQTPVAPVTGPGQVAPVGTQTLPTPRLPGQGGSGVTAGSNDTVILDVPSASITVTHSSGTHNIRKLFVREALNVTGGSLTVNYDNPKYATNDPDNLYDPASGPISAQFSAPVSLSGSASLSVYRLQVDAANTFTLGGGSLTFNQIDLMPHASTPATIAVTGDINYLPLENVTATIAGSGGSSSGFLDLGGGARTFNVANGMSSIDMAINVPITNGGLTKAGLGTLALSGANSYTGNTVVQAGQLNVVNPFLADASDVYLSPGSTLHLGFGGNDSVRALYLNGVSQSEGVWGPEGSGAEFTSPLLSGTGFLNVTSTPEPPPPPPPPAPGSVLDDFEVNEGHFNWAYNFSPPSQVFGLTNATTINRVVGEHEGLGTASQELNLVSDGSANWQLRHNSGIGTGMAAQPGGNVPLEPTGSVGFWLKTDDATAGLIQIAIDDPVPGFNSIEKGTAIQIIADNQWHLYQWDLEDADDWVAFNGGSNGEIDAVNGTITIDSVWITGSDNVQLYLDTVSHNPNGQLAAYIPGDYDRNGIVEAADYDNWRAGYGSSVPPGTGADGTGDGVVDMGDYILWRKRMPTAGSGGTGGNSTSTPEPSSLILMLAGVSAGFVCFRR